MRRSKPFLAILFLVFAVLLAQPARAHATPIEYTFSFVGSGNAQGTGYNPANVVITLLGDTSNISLTPYAGTNHYSAEPLTSTVSFNGTVYTLNVGYLESDSNASTGVEGLQIQDLAGNQTSSFIGPLSYGLGYTGGPVLLTPLVFGALYYDSSDRIIIGDAYGPVTFNAFNPTAVTPEPSSIALLATGLLGVGGLIKRRLA